MIARDASSLTSQPTQQASAPQPGLPLVKSAPTSSSLLLVDEDRPFATRLARAMESRGYRVRMAESVAEGLAAVESDPPDFAIVDVRFGIGSGLDIIAKLKSRRPDARSIVVTGHGSIAAAVSAVKLGAHDFLAKPADVNDVEAALKANGMSLPSPPENPMSAERVRWEHIQRVYELCSRNVSETSRRLTMHRRTLQRILAKRAPR